MAFALNLLRALVPAPLRAVRWRYAWLRGTSVFSSHPWRSTCKLASWTLRKLLGGELRFATPDGTRFVSMPNNASSFVVYIANDRDPAIQAFIRRHLRQGSIFVDVDANIGTYTIPAARLVGPHGRVVAIEAHPAIFQYLERNIAINGLTNAIAVQMAVGAESGKLAMTYLDINPGATHVSAGASADDAQVSVQRLDDVLARNGIRRVDYMKIDVEGFELTVLHGARQTINLNRQIVVQMEHYDAHTNRYGHSTAAVAELLYDSGLVPQRVRHDGIAYSVSRGDLAAGGDFLWSRPDYEPGNATYP